MSPVMAGKEVIPPYLMVEHPCRLMAVEPVVVDGRLAVMEDRVVVAAAIRKVLVALPRREIKVAIV